MEKYGRWYNNIVSHYSGVNDISMVEKHHIIPRSLGGLDVESNIVSVPPRVHYILHLLLYKMTSGEDRKKMWYAVWNMSNRGQIRTGAMYQHIREQATERQREIMPKVPWNKGKKGYKINQRPQKGIPKTTSYKPIKFEGVVYPSVKEAVEKSGRSYYIVSTRGTYIT